MSGSNTVAGPHAPHRRPLCTLERDRGPTPSLLPVRIVRFPDVVRADLTLEPQQLQDSLAQMTWLLLALRRQRLSLMPLGHVHGEVVAGPVSLHRIESIDSQPDRTEHTGELQRSDASPNSRGADDVTELSPEELLQAEKQSTIARIEALSSEFDDIVTGAADANSDDEHDPEGSTVAFERAKVSTLLSQGRAYLEELERAQRRIADGTYGVCEHCDAAIPRDRLAALPTARRCIQCRTAGS
jgi:DnaK suppressor protein